MDYWIGGLMAVPFPCQIRVHSRVSRLPFPFLNREWTPIDANCLEPEVAFDLLSLCSLVSIQNDTLPFELRSPEIQNHPDLEGSNPQIIQHLPPLVISNPIDDLRVYDDAVLHDQVWDVFTHRNALIRDWISRLLRNLNASSAEFDNQRILVGLLMPAMPEVIQNLDGGAHNLIDLILQQ